MLLLKERMNVCACYPLFQKNIYPSKTNTCKQIDAAIPHSPSFGTLSEFLKALLHFLTFKYFIMLGWTITFLIIAIIAAIFGFGGIAAGAAGIAKILFFVFLVLFLLSLIRGRSSL